MALFATIERDPHRINLQVLDQLVSDFQAERRSDPEKSLSIVIYGYLTIAAASDAQNEDIERGLMNRSIDFISKRLVQRGVPIDKLYVGEYVFSGPKARKIDIFLQQQGESVPNLPSNPPVAGRTSTPNFPKPARDAELSINNKREIVLEVTAFKIASRRRVLVPEISFRSSTGISPVEISKGFSSQLVLWKPKLEGLLRRIGQEGIAEKIEFAVKIKSGGALTKEFARQISVEVAASLQAALTFNITIPRTKRELPIELSYSFGAAYRSGFSDPTGGSIGSEGQGMIKVTVFRF